MSGQTRASVELMEFKKYAGTDDIPCNPETYNLLGAGGRVIVHAAIARMGGGTSASMTLTLTAEDSPDGENWAQVGAAPFVNATSVMGTDLPMTVRGVVEFPHARFLRIKANLGGTNPTAWMRVRATVKPWEG